MARPFETRAQRRTRCAPEAVIARIRDASTWPGWQPEIVSAEGPRALSTGDVVRGRAEMLGFHVDGHSTTTGADSTHYEEDVVVGVRMRLRYEVEPTADGALVTALLFADLPGGLAGRLVSFFLRWRLGHMQRAALKRLVAQSEAADSAS
jgi:hypothetical protein